MRVRAAGDHWNYVGDAKLCTFFNRPLHPVKFEDREQQADVCRGRSGNFFAEFKVNAAAGDARDSSSADCRASGDVEFLTDASAQDANQVVGVFAG